MSVEFRHFPEYGVTVNVFSGALTPEVMTRFIDRLEPIEWARWINFLDPSVDLSGLDLAHMPVMKRALASKLTTLHSDTPMQSALVSASPANDLFLQFWPSYVGRDDRYPARPVAFPTLLGACSWLALPAEAYEALNAFISSL